jgi:hypothetical protein
MQLDRRCSGARCMKHWCYLLHFAIFWLFPLHANEIPARSKGECGERAAAQAASHTRARRAAHSVIYYDIPPPDNENFPNIHFSPAQGAPTFVYLCICTLLTNTFCWADWVSTMPSRASPPSALASNYKSRKPTEKWENEIWPRVGGLIWLFGCRLFL